MTGVKSMGFATEVSKGGEFIPVVAKQLCGMPYLDTERYRFYRLWIRSRRQWDHTIVTRAIITFALSCRRLSRLRHFGLSLLSPGCEAVVAFVRVCWFIRLCLCVLFSSSIGLRYVRIYTVISRGVVQ